MQVNAVVAAAAPRSQKMSEVPGSCFDHVSHEGGVRGG